MKKYILLLTLITLLFSCNSTTKNNGKLNVVTTTTMLTDLVQNIGKDSIHIQGLMGSGVDPHLYKASEGDVSKLVNADVIFYNGLHLEGKLEELLKNMASQEQTTVPLAETLDNNRLITSQNFASNYDPHVWFDIDFFIQFSKIVAEVLSEKDPKNKAFYTQNATDYIADLETLTADVKRVVNALPKEKRILVTAHDAFNYFGQAYGFKVVGLQGLSTATEAGVKDVQQLSEFIIENNIKAIFIESSVPKRTIEALQAAVKDKGHDVVIGGTLYADALGDAGTYQGTYLGMYRHNIKTIVNALM